MYSRSKVSSREKSADAFAELGTKTDALDTFNDRSISFEEKINSLKNIIENTEQINLGPYTFGKMNDTIYYMTGAKSGIPITEDNITKIIDAAEKAQEAINP